MVSYATLWKRRLDEKIGMLHEENAMRRIAKKALKRTIRRTKCYQTAKLERFTKRKWRNHRRREHYKLKNGARYLSLNCWKYIMQRQIHGNQPPRKVNRKFMQNTKSSLQNTFRFQCLNNELDTLEKEIKLLKRGDTLLVCYRKSYDEYDRFELHEMKKRLVKMNKEMDLIDYWVDKLSRYRLGIQRNIDGDQRRVEQLDLVTSPPPPPPVDIRNRNRDNSPQLRNLVNGVDLEINDEALEELENQGRQNEARGREIEENFEGLTEEAEEVDDEEGETDEDGEEEEEGGEECEEEETPDFDTDSDSGGEEDEDEEPLLSEGDWEEPEQRE